mmetsp:Transcript_33826/g.95180  ORF Transcript_33826/g.95180 Transcript_33826/m.95180 type:complete len:206 (+) Transcript_33826:1994-2611(+)
MNVLSLPSTVTFSAFCDTFTQRSAYMAQYPGSSRAFSNTAAMTLVRICGASNTTSQIWSETGPKFSFVSRFSKPLILSIFFLSSSVSWGRCHAFSLFLSGSTYCIRIICCGWPRPPRGPNPPRFGGTMPCGEKPGGRIMPPPGCAKFLPPGAIPTPLPYRRAPCSRQSIPPPTPPRCMGPTMPPGAMACCGGPMLRPCIGPCTLG